MILYGFMDSPFVRRVAITLTHYDLPYERRSLSVYRDAEALRAVNPLGKVPALQLDDDEMIFDSQMIVDHLDTLAKPEILLTPSAGAERRAVQRVVTVALGLAEKSVALNGELRWRAADKIDPDWVARHRIQIISALSWLDSVLIGPWMMGDTLTQGDVTVVSALGHLRHRHPAVYTESMPVSLGALADMAEAQAPFSEAPFAED